MKQDAEHLSLHWFQKAFSHLGERERRIIDKIIHRQPISEKREVRCAGTLTFGQRLADKVAEFGGSWIFISLFCLFLVVWAGLNLALAARAFDPYPFIFLNLMLSMLAAIQAPIIMMSQNRQAVRDRLDAAHDYEVNLKAEIEIMALHEKLDALRTEQIRELLEKQQQQIDLLTRLAAGEKNEQKGIA
jgi:uncharacterized membrane protein